MSQPKIDAEFEAALAALTLGSTETAIRGFNAVLSREPRSAPTLANLSACYRVAGDHDLQLDYAQRAVDADPAMEGAYVALVIAFEALRRFDEAAEAAQLALKRFPGSGL